MAERINDEELFTRRDVMRAIAAGGTALAGMLILNKKGHLFQEQDTTPVGIDVSWPQSEVERLPDHFAFGIIGVTGGKTTSQNPHFADQLRWASSAEGGTDQPPLQFYINTANPGELIDQISTWPKNNVDSLGVSPRNPYGNCDGTNTAACSWQYGWNRTVEVIHNMFVPAAEKAGIHADPGQYVWWLDVETDNTWQSGSAEALARNAASLEGMVSCVQSYGGTAGIYSTHSLWKQIVGDAATDESVLNGLNSWLAGANSKSDAKQMCDEKPLTPGGRVVLTQFKKDNLDYNYPCGQ